MEMQVRNKTIDSFRGMAIIIMIAANSWPYIYPYDNCPFLLRVLFSTAAPIFIFLSGYVFQFQYSLKGKRHLYKRPLQILLLAVLIDSLVWKIVPFVTFDVLYLIAISMFVLSFLKNLDKKLFAFITLLLLFANILLIHNYEFDFSEISFDNIKIEYNFREIINHFLFDGWFPVFPWMGVFFLGFFIRKFELIKTQNFYLYVGLLFLSMYFLLISVPFQSVQPLRKGYTELFYPLTGSFWLYLLGLLCLVTYFIRLNKYFNKGLSILGTFSLPIYVIHAVFISFVLPYFNQDADNFLLKKFVIIMTLFYFIIIVYAFILKRFKILLKNGSLRYLGYVLGM